MLSNNVMLSDIVQRRGTAERPGAGRTTGVTLTE
jgi:hypothetical protein